VPAAAEDEPVQGEPSASAPHAPPAPDSGGGGSGLGAEEAAGSADAPRSTDAADASVLAADRPAEATTAAAESAEASSVDWTPPLPDAKAFDWLQVDSGEWVKGSFETLRDYKVQFDSEEFDDVELDWEEVTSFYLPRPHSFRVRGRVYSGSGELRGKVLRIRSADGVHEFEKEDVDSITRGAEREIDFWSAVATLSISAQQGNSDQTTSSASATVRRETALSRLRADYRGNLSTVAGKDTANNHRANFQSDFFLTRRFFVTVPFVEYYTDEFQNIDARVTSGLGVGYEILRGSRAIWEVNLGAGHQYNRVSDESGGGKENTQDFAVVAGTSLELDITSDIEFDNSYGVQLVVTDMDKTNHHAESVLSFDLWGPLDFDVSFIWDRTEDPPDAKPDDFRLLVGLSLDL
jgi:putative salt-induced outer membrane protein YdiY